MHKFLRAVGFSKFKKMDLEIILKEIINKPDTLKVTKDSEGNEFAELSKEFAPNIGLTVRGIYAEDDNFEMEYYYPYFIGIDKTTNEPIEIEKHSEKESYAGICDDSNLGVTLIFYMQNVCDYLSEHIYDKSTVRSNGAVLSGLSVDGCILLPIEEKKEKMTKANRKDRSQMIAQAREGDEQAIESLTMDDIDMYSILSQRVVKEDILTIVKTCFMPYGIESDQYSIIANILDYTKEENKVSGEQIYCLKVECNDLIFNVCINEKDLIGEPEIGRRFKGNIWMQGNVCL